MDIENLTLTEIVDITTLRSLQDSFAAATGMAAAVLDKHDGAPSDSKWSCRQELCERCTKHSAEGAQRCKNHMQKCVEEAKQIARPYVGTCYAGLAEFAVPIIVRGTYLGSMIGGQVFISRPDERKINATAHSLGLDANEFAAAADAVEVMSEERIEAAANLLSQMVTDAAEAGYVRAAAAERGAIARENISEDSGGANAEVKQKISEAMEYINDVKRNFELIKNDVVASTKDVHNTDSIVKTIENSSTQLTLIGFNASIEAKRAGAAGSGFNVIAQEVRTLANRNSKQVSEIEGTLNGIKRSISDINNRIRTLYGDIEMISDSMNELSYAAAQDEQVEETAE